MSRALLLAVCLAASAVSCRGKMVENEAQAEPAHKPAPAPSRQTLRRLSDDELTRSLVQKAERILDERGDDPIGTQIPFTHQGRRYVARIETHFHPAGGPKRPWGPHRGVTLFVAETR